MAKLCHGVESIAYATSMKTRIRLGDEFSSANNHQEERGMADPQSAATAVNRML
jgi:hypothetical protein